MTEFDPSSFKRFDLSDADLLIPELTKNDRQSVELVFANLYLWGFQEESYWTRYNETLYIWLKKFDYLTFVERPNDGEPTVAELADVANQMRRSGQICRFWRASSRFVQSFSDDLERFFDVEPTPRAFQEYYYDVEALANPRGTEMRYLRQGSYRLPREYPDARIVPVVPGKILDDCMKLEFLWLDHKESTARNVLDAEKDAIERLADGFERCRLEGLAVYDGDRVLGFVIYCPLNSNTLATLFLKYIPSVAGVTPFLLHEVAKLAVGRYRWIDHDCDLGIEGLRQSKTRLRPSFLLDDYSLIPKTESEIATKTDRSFPSLS